VRLRLRVAVREPYRWRVVDQGSAQGQPLINYGGGIRNLATLSSDLILVASINASNRAFFAL
jgi:hypothetical protein